MTARFAGSRSLDERRRRRLAGEWDSSEAVGDESDSTQSIESDAIAKPARTGRRRKPARRLPLRRLISPRAWKLGVVAVLLFAFGVGSIWSGYESETIGQTLGPDVERLIEPGHSRLVRAFGGLLLFVAAQLALLIWYVRSRSRRDFSGRYRSWAWGAGTGFVFSASVSLELHRFWSAAIGHVMRLDTPHFDTLCWLAPAMGCGTVLLRDLYSDMRDCRTSVFFLRMAFVCWTAAAVWLLGYGVPVPDQFSQSIIPALSLLGHYCLFLALLVHTRFVIFISAEPPDPRRSLVGSAIRIATTPLQAAIRRSKRKRAERAESNDESDSQKSKEQPAKTKASTRKKPARKKKVKQSEDQPKTSQPGADEPADSTEEKIEPDEAKHRVDSSHGTMAMPSGLSKRDRRKLRKKKAGTKR